ncbi:unnamed protein product [Hermetia illucens]|uniref:Kinesin motor domain-containing protein n=2 Tax=Hermetia illucens TaxID=343691 RepID=A0A7R8UB07_HERIL|nr:unnamed protein product [Hermetia illucens]
MSLLFAQIIISIFFTPGNAFWWSNSASTESTPVLKQIPVGYFRTYTYQPLTYPPRYSPFPSVATNQYPYDHSNIGWAQYNAPHPPIVPVKPQPLTTPPTTTTSTSTSAPQYQQNESSAAQSASNSNNQQQNTYSSLPIIEIQPGIQAPPAKIPSYHQISPDPELSSYQYFPGTVSQSVPQVQFVPCMCPVTISVGARDMSENRAISDNDDYLQRDDSDDSTLLKD